MTQGTCGGVAGIGERRLAGAQAPALHPLEGRVPQVNTAPDLPELRARPVGGGSIACDGYNSVGGWHSAGGIKFGSIEVAEVRFPFLFASHEYRPDSGGDGQFRGGTGGIVEMVIETDKPAVGNTAGDGVDPAIPAGTVFGLPGPTGVSRTATIQLRLGPCQAAADGCRQKQQRPAAGPGAAHNHMLAYRLHGSHERRGVSRFMPGCPPVRPRGG